MRGPGIQVTRGWAWLKNGRVNVVTLLFVRKFVAMDVESVIDSSSGRKISSTVTVHDADVALRLGKSRKMEYKVILFE